MKSIPKIIPVVLLFFVANRSRADFPAYSSNPFSFPIAERVAGGYLLGSSGDQFFAADLTGDGLPDFTFRSAAFLYVYAHSGSLLWKAACSNPGGNGGAKHAAADVDGDGMVEIVAINAEDQVIVFDGTTGFLEKVYPVGALSSGQKLAHVMVVNLRGKGDRDAIIQTSDQTPEQQGIGYYINRSLIAINLETGGEIWRVAQDGNPYNGVYEGYWGQAHGPAFCADVDGDGLDEAVGGNLIEENGQIIPLGYPDQWVRVEPSYQYVDHFDAVAVGDVRPDRDGLEWLVLEENDTQFSQYHTTLLSTDGILWRKDAASLKNTPGFVCTGAMGDQCLEPQNLAVGNFDPNRPGREIWNRSRFNGDGGNSQHPWIYDAAGNLIAHYRTDQSLPAGFNTPAPNGNAEGLEFVWTIDWAGGSKEYLAATARHVLGNAGIFDALTGAALFATGQDAIPSVRAAFVYVADVSGDGREELILCDSTASGPVIRIYWNDAASQAPVNLLKWEDPLYRRLKQNWNYYSPGNYTQPDVMLLDVRVFLEGFFESGTGKLTTRLNEQELIPLSSPYAEDPRSVSQIPDGAVDWALLQLKQDPEGPSVAARSVFLLQDGRLVSEHDPDGPVPFFVPEGDYFVAARHRNHLPVVGASSVRLASWRTVSLDFSVSETVAHNPPAVKSLANGIWGAAAGDANQDGLVTIADRNILMSRFGERNYLDGDLDGDGVVSEKDVLFVTTNRNRESGLNSE